MRNRPLPVPSYSSTETLSSTLSLASTNSNLARHHAQSPPSSDSTLPRQITATSGVETEFSQTSSIPPTQTTAYLFSRSPSHISDISSDSHILRIPYDPEATPPTPARHNYPLQIGDDLIQSPRSDPRYTLAPIHRIFHNPHLSGKRKQEELERLQSASIEITFQITIRFEGLNPHPIYTLAHVFFVTTPYPFITERVNIHVNDEHPYETINGKITFLNTITGNKYVANF